MDSILPFNSKEDFFQKFIPYLESTQPEQWCVDVVRSKDLSSNCLFGHLANFLGDDNKVLNQGWDWFECVIATTFMVYPVNDGKNPKYQQPTARERCIAYMKDLQSGAEQTTEAIMEEYDRAYQAKHSQA